MTFNSNEYFIMLALNLQDSARRVRELDGVKTAKYPFDNPSLDGARIFAERTIGKRRVAAELGFAPYFERLIYGKPTVELNESELIERMVGNNLAPNEDKAVDIIYGLKNMEFDTSDAGVLTIKKGSLRYVISVKSRARK